MDRTLEGQPASPEGRLMDSGRLDEMHDLLTEQSMGSLVIARNDQIVLN